MANLRPQLYDMHVSLGAKLTKFSEWEMPLSYPEGTLSEHEHCRNGSVVFDVSHLGLLLLQDAGEYLQWQLTNDIGRLQPMEAQYTHILDATDGSVIDDMICVYLGDDEYLLISNASNTKLVSKIIQGHGIQLKNLGQENVFLAIQGPKAQECLGQIFSSQIFASQRIAKKWVEKNTAGYGSFEGMEILVLGTGYTGEAGVECVVPNPVAEKFFRAILEAGAKPAGFGARDLLRLEAGFPLHGNELGKGITPLQAQMEWVLSWEKGDFCGREALLQEKTAGVSRLLRGLITKTERRPIRPKTQIQFEHQNVGEVSSGNYSPSLGYAIGMGLLKSSLEVGTMVALEDRKGSWRSAQITHTNFLRS